MISADMPYEKKRVEVNGLTMAYVDEGEGDPIVFLHGNPTSSYLWRNIMPHLAGKGRLVAPDLIGMGDSDRLPESGPGRYRLVEHREYLDGLLEGIGVTDNVTFVIHDWGSALGFDWGYRHQDAVRGFVYMEALVMPIPSSYWPEQSLKVFQAMRSEAGEEMVLENNFFVERLLPNAVLRDLSDAEMTEYRRPYVTPGEDRRPTLTWPREIPIDDSPADVCQIVGDYGAWLSKSDLPKLFINADPGAILTGNQREFCRAWPNQTEVTVKGHHFIQEDSPDEIGTAIADWYGTLG
jgi:haloalkane dehalogenase